MIASCPHLSHFSPLHYSPLTSCDIVHHCVTATCPALIHFSTLHTSEPVDFHLLLPPHLACAEETSKLTSSSPTPKSRLQRERTPLPPEHPRPPHPLHPRRRAVRQRVSHASPHACSATDLTTQRGEEIATCIRLCGGEVGGTVSGGEGECVAMGRYTRSNQAVQVGTFFKSVRAI